MLHWALAISFTLLLITIFLRLTWMNKFNVSAIIQDYLTANDIVHNLSQDQLIVLAKKIRQPMWDWHVYIGYALVVLFGIRFTLPFFGEMKFQSPFAAGLTSKEKFQKWMYIIFYAFAIVSLITGLIIVWGPKEFKKTMESIHELSIYYLGAYMLLHIGGVIIAELTSDKGIISRIVSGKKEEK